jgi:hypothetical protein
MSQKARPIYDIAKNVSGWSPTPVYDRINEPAPDDTTYVSSSNNPQGDTFEVKLAQMGWPEAGVDFLTVRLQQVGGGSDSVTITLLQGNGTIIASRQVQAPASFANAFGPPLSPAEIALITDYSDLHVRVTAGFPVVPCCPGNMPVQLHANITDLGGCACLAGSFPLLWDGKKWSYTGNLCNNQSFSINLLCSGSNCNSFVLAISCNTRPIVSGTSPVSCSCSPFSLSFVNIPSNTSCCNGTIGVTVTL